VRFGDGAPGSLGTYLDLNSPGNENHGRIVTSKDENERPVVDSSWPLSPLSLEMDCQ
jgi:hypothetical protein